MRSNTNSSEVESFGWIRKNTIHEAACLTFVRAAEIAPVATAFGGVPEHARTLDFEEFCEEAFAHYEQYSMIGVRRLGDWLLVVEDNARQGTRQEVLRRVSEGTEVVSAFWNAHALTRFSRAVDGEVRTSFEALMPDCREGTRPDDLERVRAGLPWATTESGNAGANTVELMLALSARITGETLEPDWFGGDFETYPVAEWPDDLPQVQDVVDPRAGREHPPELVAALRTADCCGRRRAAWAVARRVLEAAECLDHPVISKTLSALSRGLVDKVAINEAVRLWQWQITAHRATSRARRQVGAAEVLRQATNDNALVAVLAALSAGRRVRGVQAAELADVASGALAKP